MKSSRLNRQETKDAGYVLRSTFYVLNVHSLIFWLGAALLVSLFYLAVAAWGFGVSGFPLDDAWIHQTYARNLAGSGQLAFTPGVPSAGSTAPLWTFLLSLGYLLGLPFKVWTYGLGILFLGLTGWSVMRLGRRLFPEAGRIGLWAGLFAVFEWHLTWAAVSGMETILFIWLSIFLVERYLACRPLPALPATSRPPAGEAASLSAAASFFLGFLGGLLTLTRPEGLGLLGLIGLDLAYRTWGQSSPRRSRILALAQNWLGMALGAGLLLTPYIAFHLWATGYPFPNTLYAKQAEYGIILQSFPLWRRLFGPLGPAAESVQGVFRVIFIGPQLLLLPGLLLGAGLTLIERRFELLFIWTWWVGYLLLYALRLPVTYQHGRYQIPAIVWVILLGVWGTGRLLRSRKKTAQSRFLIRVARRSLLISLLLLSLGFTLIGAQAYGRDVRFIESEMVATATWLAENIEADALIAAHDIGAIGYFTQRPIIDLAGLATPDVIPIIRDEPALLEFILRRQADYLATFPSWYPYLTGQPFFKPLYSTNAPWTVQAGGDNMVVYEAAEPY